jgi:hypothetical protein
MAQRSALELLVAECNGGRGHCRRGAARPGAIVLTRHPRSTPPTVGLDFPPGAGLSAPGLERAYELAALWLLCGWITKSTVAISHLRFDLRPSRSRAIRLATILDAITDDLMGLVRLHAIVVAENEQGTS